MTNILTNNISITILLIVAAVCQILGTISVAVNYYRTGVIAKLIDDASQAQLANIFWERQKLATVAKQLKRQWWLTLGLFAYILAAVSGLCASLIWLFR